MYKQPWWFHRLASLPVSDEYYKDWHPHRQRHLMAEIDTTEIQEWFCTVICPLTDQIMHLDKTGLLWPCTGCTQPNDTKCNHVVYCLRSNVFGNNTFCLWEDLPDHLSIPKQYMLAYRAFDYAQFCNVMPWLINFVGKINGGVQFHVDMAISTSMTSASLNCNPNVICNECTFGCSFNDGHARDSKLTTELNGKLMTEPSDAMDATVKVQIPCNPKHPKLLVNFLVNLLVNLLWKQEFAVRRSIQKQLIQRRGLLHQGAGRRKVVMHCMMIQSVIERSCLWRWRKECGFICDIRTPKNITRRCNAKTTRMTPSRCNAQTRITPKRFT